jgi:hypothetical protein
VLISGVSEGELQSGGPQSQRQTQDTRETQSSAEEHDGSMLQCHGFTLKMAKMTLALLCILYHNKNNGAIEKSGVSVLKVLLGWNG